MKCIIDYDLQLYEPLGGGQIPLPRPVHKEIIATRKS